MTVIEETKVCSRAEIIAEWYIHVFPRVATHVNRNGGDLEAAKEIFQESIVAYYEKLNQSNFNPEQSHEAYLFGIARNRWLKHLAERSKHTELTTAEVVEESVSTPIADKVMKYLRQSGEKCMDLLQAFYYEKLNMKQLSERFGYTSERSATVQKYKCLEKVRNEVKRKSLSYEDFLN